MSGPLPSPVPAVALTAVLVASGLAGWDVFVEPTPTERCVAAAAWKLDRLERVADRRFRSVGHTTTTRYDGCDDTGRPSASLIVRVDSWTRRAEGRAFLQRPPWRWEQRERRATLVGRLAVTAHIRRSTESDGSSDLSVVLTFPS